MGGGGGLVRYGFILFGERERGGGDVGFSRGGRGLNLFWG